MSGGVHYSGPLASFVLRDKRRHWFMLDTTVVLSQSVYRGSVTGAVVTARVLWAVLSEDPVLREENSGSICRKTIDSGGDRSEITAAASAGRVEGQILLIQRKVINSRVVTGE